MTGPVTDRDTPPMVKIVSPPDGAVLVDPAEVTILARAHAPSGWVRSVEFFVDGQSIGIDTWEPSLLPVEPTLEEANRWEWRPPNLFRMAWTEPTPGRHQLTAVATDNLGQVSPKAHPVEIEIVSSGALPIVTVVATDPEAAEGPGDPDAVAVLDTATFEIRRTGDTSRPLEVFFRLAGSALNGEDYEWVEPRITIPEGESAAEVVIRPIDDDLCEGPETVVLILLPPIMPDIAPGREGGYWVGHPRQARAVIWDNDCPPNQPPVVRLTRPQSGEIFLAPAEVFLQAAAWDFDGRVVEVEFFEGDNSLGVVTEPDPVPLGPEIKVPTYSLLWTDVPVGDYVLTAVATDNEGAAQTSRPVRIRVIELVAPPVVTVVATDPEASEPDPWADHVPDTAVFTISRTGPLDHPLLVYYRLGGTAQNGIDYERLPGRIIIPQNAPSAEVVVVPLHDDEPEGTETVLLRLVPPCCVDDVVSVRPRYVVGEPGSAKAWILDNDEPANVPPRIGIIRPRDGQLFLGPTDVTIKAVGVDPDGYIRRVQFMANGQVIHEETIEFVREPDPGVPQTFVYTWENVGAGRHVLQVRVFDNDEAQAESTPVRIAVIAPHLLPVVTVWATDPIGAETGMLTVIDPAVFTLYRTGDLSDPLEVKYSLGGTAENGVDYLELSGIAKFEAGEKSVDVVVIPYNDDLVEGVETVLLKLEAPDCSVTDPPPAGCYMVGIPGRAWAVILDADGPPLPPRVEIVKPLSGTVFRAPADIPMLAQAWDRDGKVVRVEFYANRVRIGEGQPVAAETGIDPGPGGPQAFAFTWLDVPAGRYALQAKATDNDGLHTMSAPVWIAVSEKPEAPVVTLFVTDPVAAERGPGNRINTAQFKVRRSGGVEEPLTVYYSIDGTAENGTDYVRLPGYVEIPSGSRWATITITPIDDDEPEGVETVVLELVPSPAVGPTEPYRCGIPKRGVAIILDNDIPRPGLRGLPDGLQHIRFGAQTGQAYRIEASEDLQTWMPLGDVLAEGDAVDFIEPEAARFPHRFYRIRPIVEAALETRD